MLDEVHEVYCEDRLQLPSYATETQRETVRSDTGRVNSKLAASLLLSPLTENISPWRQMSGRLHQAAGLRLLIPNGTSSNKIQKQLRRHFIRCGTPERMSMDGGTNSEY